MGDLVLKGATSGQITITPTGVAGTNTLTLPAKTGNIITSADSGTVTQAMLASNVAGNGPAFSAYQNSAQSISNSTFTKLQCSTVEFNQGSYYDGTTNYRFTPLVAGYYLITGEASLNAATQTQLLTIYKNGSEFKRGQRMASSPGALSTSVSALINFNGSTDYVELYVWQDSGSTTTLNAASQALNYFQGVLVRTA